MRDEPVNETGAYLTLNYLTKEGVGIADVEALRERANATIKFE
jgi:hypothetical protein